MEWQLHGTCSSPQPRFSSALRMLCSMQSLAVDQGVLKTSGCCWHPALGVHTILKSSSPGAAIKLGFAGKDLHALHRGTPCHGPAQAHQGVVWTEGSGILQNTAAGLASKEEMFITGLGLAFWEYSELPCVKRTGNISLPEGKLRQKLTPAELLRFLAKGRLCFE